MEEVQEWRGEDETAMFSLLPRGEKPEPYKDGSDVDKYAITKI